MKKEYIFLILGLIVIWILGFLLFVPTENRREPAISDEGKSTTIEKEVSVDEGE